MVPLTALAQQPIVEDLSSSSDSFYQQTQTQPTSGGSLVLFNQVQEHQREIQQLRGQLEELRHEFEQVSRQSQQRYIDIDDRLASLERDKASSAAEEEADTATPAPESSVEPKAIGEAERVEKTEQSGSNSVSEEVQKAYENAFSHVQARHFDEAITAFKGFVEQYPDSSLTPNGYYWLGELYAANDALATAEEAFDRVINEYSDSRKVPDALYKLGLLKARQGKTDRSRELLTRVTEEYPQSSAAGLASDFLRQSL
ncbi:tol-pal system protein YbgF [Halomonas llamarensis]|uniref:Cell division coordinator CpoB n=1 Tax=Halomonas llamarensis TaxID=2945104 RepID=A0ABT0SRB1_9GAMM|nr:tol-pal system protein YbgF [Halomonas llamarensis]MCL7930171.1 tol-pal system protein YbgF [Halomonas llamarensis]